MSTNTHDPETQKPRRPRGLRKSGREIWDDLTARYEMHPHELSVVLQIARMADRLDQLHTEAAAAAATTVTDQVGRESAHPAIVEARQTALAQARLVASLRLPEEDESDVTGTRPQRRGGTRGFYSGGAR